MRDSPFYKEKYPSLFLPINTTVTSFESSEALIDELIDFKRLFLSEMCHPNQTEFEAKLILLRVSLFPANSLHIHSVVIFCHRQRLKLIYCLRICAIHV